MSAPASTTRSRRRFGITFGLGVDESRYLTIGATTVRVADIAAWRLEAVGESGAATVTRVWLRSGSIPLTIEGDHHASILEVVSDPWCDT